VHTNLETSSTILKRKEKYEIIRLSKPECCNHALQNEQHCHTYLQEPIYAEGGQMISQAAIYSFTFRKKKRKKDIYTAYSSRLLIEKDLSPASKQHCQPKHAVLYKTTHL